MYLKDDHISVTIGNTTFNTSPSGSGPQFVLDPDAILGWYDAPGSSRDAVTRANGWGDFPEKSKQGSRVVTLSGTAVAANIRDLQALRDRLVGLFENGEYREMAVRTSDGVRYASVGIEGSVSWIRQSDTIAVWKLSLYAPDPRIYGVEHKVQLGGGRAATGMAYPIKYPINYGNQADRAQGIIENNGNTESWPKFLAQGTMPYGFVLHNNRGRVVSFKGMVSAQSPVLIDMSKGTATQNGVDKTMLMDTRQWFSIAPDSAISPGFDPIQGGNTPITAGWCDILYRDTWI